MSKILQWKFEKYKMNFTDLALLYSGGYEKNNKKYLK